MSAIFEPASSSSSEEGSNSNSLAVEAVDDLVVNISVESGSESSLAVTLLG